MYPGCNPDVDPHGGGLDALISLYHPYISPYLPISPAHPGAHAFVLLPRRTALERRLSDGLAFVDKCRLLAKVDGDGVEQRTYLLEFLEPVHLNIDPFHLRMCMEASSSLA